MHQLHANGVGGLSSLRSSHAVATLYAGGTAGTAAYGSRKRPIPFSPHPSLQHSHASSPGRMLGVGMTRTPSRAVLAAAAAALQAPEGADAAAPLPRGGRADEAAAEARLRSGVGDGASSHIYGIPREEWLGLQTPTRYMGNEFGAVHKPWDSARIRFSLTYPEIYEVGASNLGHIILYTVLNEAEGLLCDRAYFPAADMSALLSRHGLPLFAVESRRPLRDFDVLGFSLAYELGCTNILEMVRMSGVPVSWQERLEPDGQPWDPAQGSWPFVFAGGPTATSNPEPFADFFDFFALGDGEELLVEIGRCLESCRTDGLDRRSSLLRLATTVEGVYVPQFYEAPEGFGGSVVPMVDGVPARVKRRVAQPDPFQQIGLVPYIETVHDRMTVEIRRGCTRGCRFCQPGMLTRPARDVEPERVVEAVVAGMRKTGYTEFSLLSLSCSDYLALPAVGLEIKNRLRDEGVSLSLPSQRVDRFDDNIAAIVGQGQGKKSGLTFAPEAGTQRLRDIINKGLTNEELLRGVRTAWDRGWKQVKLYFMIGLPGETDADVMGIPETIEWLQRECRNGKWHLAVNVTISNFTPKPHTPFQWHTVSTSEFVRKTAMLREALAKMPQVKANFTGVRTSAMEDFIGRGDRRVAKVICRAWEMGALNDSWWESEDKAYRAWCSAIEEVGMTWKYRQVEDGEWNVLEALGDPRFRRQGGGGKGRLDRGDLADSRLDMPLPWDHIDTGIAKWWLKTDLQRALEAATVPDCSHSGLCSECGVCEEGAGFGQNVVAPVPPIPEFKGHYKPRTKLEQRLRFRFAKSGDMVFVGHLDLMRTIDRALRRAALPVSSTKSPFRSMPLVALAQPLPLGATSSCEALEVVLSERMDPQVAQERLQAQLPPGMKLQGSAQEVELYKADGSRVENMPKLMTSVEWYIAVQQVGDATGSADVTGTSAPATATRRKKSAATATSASTSAADAAGGSERLSLPADMAAAVSGVRRMRDFIVQRTTLRSKQKVSEDLRALLYDISLSADPLNTPMATAAPTLLGRLAMEQLSLGRNWAVIRFSSGKKEDHNLLAPERVVDMLSAAAGAELRLVHCHRSKIEFQAPPAVPMNSSQVVTIRSLIRWEGHMAVKKQFGIGAWAAGLENRPLRATDARA